MKKILTLILIAISTQLLAQTDVADIYKKTINSTVTIETDKGFGSGFFIQKNIIVTNYHVIKGSKGAIVQIGNDDSKMIDVQCIVATDPANDLALLKLDYEGTPLTIESNKVEIGQEVVAIGSPSGLSGTATKGILSSVRDLAGVTVLQFSAAVSPGSSGSPLLNSEGNVVGIVAGAMDGNSLNIAIYVKHLNDLITAAGDMSCQKIEASEEESACDLSMEEIQDNAKLMIRHLGSYISVIGSPDANKIDKDNAIKYATELFAPSVYDPKSDIYREPQFEVSGLRTNDNGTVSAIVKRYRVPVYFSRLSGLPYHQVVQEWTDIVPLGKCATGPDGVTRCEFMVRQVFKGIIDNKVVYEDITDKRIEVIVGKCETTVNGETIEKCCLKLGDVYVEKTYK